MARGFTTASGQSVEASEQDNLSDITNSVVSVNSSNTNLFNLSSTSGVFLGGMAIWDTGSGNISGATLDVTVDGTTTDITGQIAEVAVGGSSNIAASIPSVVFDSSLTVKVGHSSRDASAWGSVKS